MSKQKQGTVMRFREWLAARGRRNALIRCIKRGVRFYRADDDNYAGRVAGSDN